MPRSSEMILDDLPRAASCIPLHPLFRAAFDFLRRPDLARLSPGRHELDGNRLYAMVMTEPGKGRDRARLEAHRRYIDIQYTIAGAEEIGWAPLAVCRRANPAYDETKDLVFFEERPESWFAVPA